MTPQTPPTTAIPARCVLAIDQGTTSSRAILFDAHGLPLATAQEEFAQHARTCAGPDGEDLGIVEHDAEDIWRSQLACCRRVLETAGISAAQVAAIGVTNQRETTILWDKADGRPVAPAIVWQSRVSAPICRRLEAEGLGPEVARRTGLRLDPYFSATKIMHLLETVPGLRDRCARGDVLFGTVDTFLIWRLTGGRVHATDPTNASRTLLYDIHRRQWSADLCTACGVPMAMLPEVRPSSGDFGTLDPALLGAPIPIAGCAGDQQAAAFGQGCVTDGAAKTTYGTGAFLIFSTGDRPVTSGRGLLTTLGCPAAAGGPPTYALEGSVFLAGGGVVIVPALTGLGAPHWDPHARGLIIGLSRATHRGHVARAALEAIACSVADVVECMEADAGRPLDRLRVDGGATANDLLMQIQADVLGRPVDRPAVLETTALGAALLAGMATGVYANAESVAAARRVERSFAPAADAATRNRLRERWADAVGRSRGWAAAPGRPG